MKLGAALFPLLLVTTATSAFAQTVPAEPAPAPAAPAPVAAQPVVVVSPGPVVVTQPAAPPSATPAVATAATAPAAPQTHAWSDVSNINGQLVKVGESNEYLKTYKRTNISSNPIGWVLGTYGVSVSYGLTNNIAIRGDVGVLSNYLDENTTGFSVGVGAPLYFKRTYQGAFLEPGFAVMTVSRNDNYDYAGCSDCSTSSTATVAGPQMLFGWHWTWDSGFNVALAAGIGRNWSNEGEYSKIFPNGYFRVGYAF